jgi:hypothetical protein
MPIVPENGELPEASLPAEEADTCEVGYGKPPRHSRFKPGKSGNPKGRPKRAKGFKTLVRAAMLQRVRVRSGGRERTVSRAEALLLKAIEHASKDNFKATERLLAWYQEAVPDAPAKDIAPPRQEDLTDADRETLEALRRSIEAELASPAPTIRRRPRHGSI